MSTQSQGSKVQEAIIVALSVVVACLVFADQLYFTELIINENNMYRKWFVNGPMSFLGADQSFLWMTNGGFGGPRLGNPLFYSFAPTPYLSNILSEPYQGYVLWIGVTALGLWGGWKFFSLFTGSAAMAFIASAALVLSGAVFGSAVIGLYAEKIVFVPWVLYLFYKGLQKGSLALMVIGGAVHALHFITGPSYLWFYMSAGIGMLIPAYFVRSADDFRSQWRAIAWSAFKFGGVFFGVCAALIVAMLLPAAEYSSLAVHRELSDIDYAYSGRFNPLTLFEFPFFFPGAFGYSRQFQDFELLSYLGWVPMFFAFVWLRTAAVKQILWVFGLLLIVLMAAGSIAPVDTILRAMPALGVVRYSAYWMLAWNILILVLAINVANRMVADISLARFFREGIICYLLCILMFAVLLLWRGAEIQPELFRPLVMGGFVLAVLAASVRFNLKRETVLSALSVVALIDLVSWAMQAPQREMGPNHELAKHLNVLAGHADTVQVKSPPLGSGRAFAFRSEEGKCQYLTASGSGYEWALHFSAYPLRRSYEVSKQLGWREGLACSMFGLEVSARDTVTEDWLSRSRALNIKYYFVDSAQDETFLKALGFQFFAKDRYSGFSIYEDPAALSRVQFFQDMKTVADMDAAIGAFKQSSTPMMPAIVETTAPSWTAEQNKRSTTVSQPDFKITEYSPTQVVIRGVTETSGLLVLLDMPFPGWEVQVDGKDAQLLPTNIVGRGVFLTAGQHTVTFAYSPSFVMVSLFLNIVAAACILIYGMGYLSKLKRLKLLIDD